MLKALLFGGKKGVLHFQVTLNTVAHFRVYILNWENLVGAINEFPEYHDHTFDDKLIGLFSYMSNFQTIFT